MLVAGLAILNAHPQWTPRLAQRHHRGRLDPHLRPASSASSRRSSCQFRRHRHRRPCRLLHRRRHRAAGARRLHHLQGLYGVNFQFSPGETTHGTLAFYRETDRTDLHRRRARHVVQHGRVQGDVRTRPARPSADLSSPAASRSRAGSPSSTCTTDGNATGRVIITRVRLARRDRRPRAHDRAAARSSDYGLRLIAHHTFFVMDGWIAVLLGVLLCYFGYLSPPKLSARPALRAASSRRRR